jgi:hypothetical protein
MYKIRLTYLTYSRHAAADFILQKINCSVLTNRNEGFKKRVTIKKADTFEGIQPFFYLIKNSYFPEPRFNIYLAVTVP